MLIGISGCSGSGKTTLASLLAAKLNACLIGEVASYVAGVWRAEKGMSLAEIRAYDATRFQLEVLEEQIKREDEALQNHDIVIGTELSTTTSSSLSSTTMTSVC